MKETKKFFDNNRLNKGYTRSSNYIQSDTSLFRQRNQNVLPPLEVMSAYEELNPGTLENLLDMAKREQNHRHTIELLALEKRSRSLKNSRLFFVVFVAIISITSVIMALLTTIETLNIFLISAFSSLAVASVFTNKISEQIEQKFQPTKSDQVKFSTQEQHKKHEQDKGKSKEILNVQQDNIRKEGVRNESDKKIFHNNGNRRIIKRQVVRKKV